MNEDWDTEIVEPRAGEELERMLDRYARVRLDPSTAQAKRARSAVMEAAWRQRLAPPEAAPEAVSADTAASRPYPVDGTAQERRGGPFSGWSARRIGVAFAAAALAGLMLGTTTFAASRAGGLLYDARLALEELTLPADADARLEAEIAMAQGRLAEILDGVARDDPGAVAAAVRGYRESLDQLDGARGQPADRALEAIQFHRQVLLGVLERAPADALAGLQNALAESSEVIVRLDAAGTTPSTGGQGGGAPNPNAGGANGRGGGTGGNPNAGGANGGNPAHPGTKPAQPAAQPTAKPTKAPTPARTAEPAPEQNPTKPDTTARPNGQDATQGGKP